MLKRIFTIFSISLILTGSFFSVYNIKYPVYADTNTDEWMNVTTNQQLVEAFRYYCKSRDLTIEGSVADAVTSFTTKAFNGICNTLGIDVTALQAQIKYQTDGNLGTRFLFTTTGIDAYNRIFAQFLQDNELSVGDENVDKTVASGEWYSDDDGNGGYVWYVNNLQGGTTAISIKGTYIKYQPEFYSSFPSNITLTFNINNVTYNYLCNSTYSGGSSPNHYVFLKRNSSTNGVSETANTNRIVYYFNTSQNNVSYSGSTAILKYGSNYYLGAVVDRYNNTYDWVCYWLLPNDRSSNGNVYINSTVINNNTYEGDTIINNNGDTNNYYPDNPDNPDIPDPNPNPTPDPPTIPDSGGWQDFSLPDMPNDWLIYGMERKFPFDIPFNILFALSLLNHEPEIPKFEGDIDLKVCTWHYDIDLTPFDDIATILRKFEVLGFIIGLAILTKNLINWG